MRSSYDIFLFCTGLKYCQVQFHFDIAFTIMVFCGKEHSEISQHCTFFKNSLKIAKRKSEDVNRIRTENTMTKDKGQKYKQGSAKYYTEK